MALVVACGVGRLTMLRLSFTLTTVLDFFKGFDVSRCTFDYELLVGGMWHDGSQCGLWCWTVNNASSIVNSNYGARLIILVTIHIKGFGVFCTGVLPLSFYSSCRR